MIGRKETHIHFEITCNALYYELALIVMFKHPPSVSILLSAYILGQILFSSFLFSGLELPFSSPTYNWGQLNSPVQWHSLRHKQPVDPPDLRCPPQHLPPGSWPHHLHRLQWLTLQRQFLESVGLPPGINSNRKVSITN